MATYGRESAERWSGRAAPSLDDLHSLAEAAFARLPETFRKAVAGVTIHVDDFPSDEVLQEMGLESPFDLLGLYQGVDLTRASLSDPSPEPDRIFLYRRPILDFWCEEGETLEHVVTHVLVHEIGHHFGLSDEDMEAIEAGLK
ncbi:MAG: metallopeptidase family protein [Pseudomonadota bacterium]